MKLEVLTPLHIGNGNTFTLLDFVIENNKFMKINFDSVAEDCFKKDINLTKELEEHKENFELEKFFKKYDLKPEDYLEYSIPINIDPYRIRKTKPQIKEFIKVNKFPYIPGSSIKGAIRTALLWKVLNNNEVNRYCNELMIKRDVKPKTACKKLEEKIFGEDPHKDILRVVRVSDTNPFKLEDLKIEEIKIIGNPQPIPTYLECLKPGSISKFELNIDEKLLNENIFRNNKVKKYLNIKELFNVCNEFYLENVNKQLNYRYDTSTKQEFEKLKKVIENLKENETILNIGWGGGWYPKTIGLKVENYQNFTTDSRYFNQFRSTLRFKLKLGRNPRSKKFVMNFPKTRRLTIDNIPLGWIKVVK